MSAYAGGQARTGRPHGTGRAGALQLFGENVTVAPKSETFRDMKGASFCEEEQTHVILERGWEASCFLLSCLLHLKTYVPLRARLAVLLVFAVLCTGLMDVRAGGPEPIGHAATLWKHSFASRAWIGLPHESSLRHGSRTDGPSLSHQRQAAGGPPLSEEPRLDEGSPPGKKLEKALQVLPRLFLRRPQDRGEAPDAADAPSVVVLGYASRAPPLTA